MARIPVVRERSVQQQGFQAATMQAPPADALGVDITGAVEQGIDIATRWQEEANQVATLEADNQLQAWENEYLYNPESGIMNTRGKNAFGLPEQSEQAFNQQRENIRASLANDRQRLAFDQAAQRRQQEIQSLVNRHVSREAETYSQEQTTSYVTRSREAAALNYNDPLRINAEIERQQAAIEAQGRRAGLSDDALAIARDEARSSTLRVALERMIAERPNDAMGRYREIEGQLSIEDRQQLKPEIQKLEARAISHSLMGAINGGGAPGDESLWQRLIRQESGGQQFGEDGQPLTSSAGAVGVAQVMPDTAPEAARLAGLPWSEERYRNDPEYNEALGRAYFEKQVDDYGMPLLAAAAYNAGPGRVQEWIAEYGDPRTGEITAEEFAARIPFKETRDYVRNVVGEENYSTVTGEQGMQQALNTIRQIEDPEVRRMALADFSRANSEFNQLRSVEQAELNARVEDATAAYMQGLDYERPPTQNEFFQAYGAAGAQRYEEFRQAQQVGDALRSMALASPEQRAETLAGLRPDRDGVAGEGFANANQQYAALVNAAEQMEEQINTDPVRYIAQHSQQMRTIMEAVDPNNRASVDAFASAMIQEQRRLGVEQPKLLTEQHKAQIVQGFARTDEGGNNAAELIGNLQQEWGNYWPQVFRQLQDDLPGAALVIGTGVAPEVGARLARIADIPTADLKASLPATDTRDGRDYLNDEMADFRVTMMHQVGGERTFTTLYQEAERLAYSYMAEGVSARDAATRAYAELVDDRYTINETYRVPRDVDAGLVERGLDAELDAMDVDDIFYQQADWMDGEFAADQIHSVLRDNGYWVTNGDETGVVLYVDGEAVLNRDGEPVTRSWDQLTQRAIDTPGAFIRFLEGARELRGVQRETQTRSWGEIQ